MSKLTIETETVKDIFKLVPCGKSAINLFWDDALVTIKSFNTMPVATHFWVDDKLLGQVYMLVLGGYFEKWYIVNRDGSPVRIHFWDQPRFEDFKSARFKNLGIAEDVHIHRYHLWNKLVSEAQPIREIIL